MEKILEQIEAFKKEMKLFSADTMEAAEAFRIKFLGTKYIEKNIMGKRRNVPNEVKKQFCFIQLSKPLDNFG